MNPLGDNGKNGNDVDFAQRTAPSMRRKGNLFFGDAGRVIDEGAEQPQAIDQPQAAEENFPEPHAYAMATAERMMRGAEKDDWRLRDPEEKARQVRSLAAKLAEDFDENGRLTGNRPRRVAKTRAVEENEQPFDQNKFFGNIKEMQKQVPKKL